MAQHVMVGAEIGGQCRHLFARTAGDVDADRLQPVAPVQRRGLAKLLPGQRAVGAAVARDVAAAVGQQDENRRAALTLHRKGEPETGIQAGDQRRRPAARQARQGALCQGERARGRQDDAGRGAAKGDQRHLVPPHIAARQQLFDGALGLAQPFQRCRARGIHQEDRRRGRLVAQPLIAEILLADQQARRCLRGRVALRLKLLRPQFLPGGGGAQCRDKVRPCIGIGRRWRGREGPAAPCILLHCPGLAGPRPGGRRALRGSEGGQAVDRTGLGIGQPFGGRVDVGWSVAVRLRVVFRLVRPAVGGRLCLLRLLL